MSKAIPVTLCTAGLPRLFSPRGVLWKITSIVPSSASSNEKYRILSRRCCSAHGRLTRRRLQEDPGIVRCSKNISPASIAAGNIDASAIARRAHHVAEANTDTVRHSRRGHTAGQVAQQIGATESKGRRIDLRELQACARGVRQNIEACAVRQWGDPDNSRERACGCNE